MRPELWITLARCTRITNRYDRSARCERFATKILNREVGKADNSLAHIMNVYYPSPITILDLARIVQRTVMKVTNNTIQPKIEIVDTGRSLYSMKMIRARSRLI